MKFKDKHSALKHMLHMVICCGLPIVIVLLLPFVSKFNTTFATALGFITPFICPIMMGTMVFMMLGNKKKAGCCGDTEDDIDVSECSTK